MIGRKLNSEPLDGESYDLTITQQGPANRKFWFELTHESNRRLRFEFESNQDVVVYVFSDEQRCAVSHGSSNNIARSLLQSRVLVSVYALAT